MDEIADGIAVERVSGAAHAPVVISCEHASEAMPAGWSWPDADRRLVGTHWAYNLGAAELARELSARLEAPAVLSRFSRLLVDPNRPLDSDTLFRTHADGEPIALNTPLVDDAERIRRIERLWDPFHRALERTVARSEGEVLLSVHTFTPTYEGQRRAVEIGVLFDEEESLAKGLAAALSRTGMRVELNEPWSGKAGLIYSADRHARAHRRRPVELEVRQDLAVEPTVRARIVSVLATFFAMAR